MNYYYFKCVFFALLLMSTSLTTIAQTVTVELWDCENNIKLSTNDFNFNFCGQNCNFSPGHEADGNYIVHTGEYVILGVSHSTNNWILAHDRNGAIANASCGYNSCSNTNYYNLLQQALFEYEWGCFWVKDEFTVQLCVKDRESYEDFIANLLASGLNLPKRQLEELAKMNWNSKELKPIYWELKKGNLKGALGHINKLNINEGILQSLSYKDYNALQNISLIGARVAKVLKQPKEAIKYYGYLDKMTNRIPQQKVKYAKEYSDYLIDIGELYKAKEVLEDNLIMMPNDFYKERSWLLESLGDVDKRLYKYQSGKGKKWKDINYLDKRAKLRYKEAQDLLKQGKELQKLPINPKDFQRLDEKIKMK